MAIIPAVAGIKVDICVDGDALEEFRDPSDSDNAADTVITRYVIAQPGKTFAIRYKFEQSFFSKGNPPYDACIWVSIDGQHVRGTFIEADRDKRLDSQLLTGSECQNLDKEWIFRKFTFASVSFVDNQTSSTTSKDFPKLQEMGTISVKIERGRVGRSTTASPCVFNSIDEVHEKFLKGQAKSCTTTMTNAGAIPAPKSKQFRREGKEVAEFQFKYRSLSDLKAEMIIPRSPSPIPIEDRPVDELTREELAELVRRHRAAGPPVKQESKRARASSATAQDSDDVSMIEQHVKRRRPIATIDLTSD